MRILFDFDLLFVLFLSAYKHTVFNLFNDTNTGEVSIHFCFSQICLTYYLTRSNQNNV